MKGDIVKSISISDFIIHDIMETYEQTLNKFENYALGNNKEPSAIKMLMLHYSNMESSELYLKLNNQIPKDVLTNLTKSVKDYVEDNIPVQHIIGYEYFYGHKFIVNEDVLIPRFETEELVSHILMTYDEVFKDELVSVVDIGTGSGCLAITLDLEEQNMNVLATDISKEALNVAKENNLNLLANVEFIQGDMLDPLEGRKFDIIVSNPPYIPKDEFVESLVKDNEPNIALFGGNDGLKFYRIIIENIKAHLNDKYIIAFEHAHNTGNQIVKLARENFPNAKVKLIKDMQGKDRMTFIIKE